MAAKKLWGYVLPVAAVSLIAGKGVYDGAGALLQRKSIGHAFNAGAASMKTTATQISRFGDEHSDVISEGLGVAVTIIGAFIGLRARPK